MNWGALLTVLLGVLEKNPGLLENLITSLLNLFVTNPAVLNKAVTVGLAHAEASIPKTVTPVAVV